MPPDYDLQSLLQRVWVPSSKQPSALLSPSDLQFAQQLVATRRSDGSWASFENPRQTLLHPLVASLRSTAPDWDWGHYEASPHEQRNSAGNIVNQSVRLPLQAKFRGPFSGCRSPDFEKLDLSWPRDNETSPAEAEAWALAAAARKDELRRHKEQKLARRQSAGHTLIGAPRKQQLKKQKLENSDKGRT